MRPISLDEISKLLPAPNWGQMIDEAFELRWLVSERPVKPCISIQKPIEWYEQPSLPTKITVEEGSGYREQNAKYRARTYTGFW